MPEQKKHENNDRPQSSTLKARWGPLKLHINPVVSLVSALIIWGFVIWCILQPDAAKTQLTHAKTWVTDTWTWLYIGTQDAWILFVAYLYFSKYANLKLGKPDEKPEFGDVTYFTMLFAAGLGIGLFYFGVAEPVWHYEPGSQYGNRYWGRYSDNQRAQDAINLTYYHWGIHAWVVYVLVGLLLGFMCHRKGLPMTISSCFYPLLGDRIFGLIGDLINMLSIVCTMFGVCTSLGLGVIQFNSGLKRLDSDIEENGTNQIIIIWAITALATFSVVSGLKVGVRRLSEICFAVGMFLMLVVLLYDDTWHILNLLVQSIGYYVQTIVQLGFHTDAMAQLGNAPDGKESPEWMDTWTIFYWGWWTAWSPFVGMFIAKISRGRTIKQFITYTLAIPVLYSFLWFAVFGGAAFRMERNAALAGITCNSTLGGAASTESQDGLYRLSCRGKSDMWFDLISQYGDSSFFGYFLSIVSLGAIVLYFVTSSDSGSLVIDSLASNGDPEPPIPQRVFWAFTEGACATALLYAGGSDALIALQTVSIVVGLLYTIILNFFCVAMWKAVRIETSECDPNGPRFRVGIFEVLERLSLKRLTRLLVAIAAPWWSMSNTAAKVYRSRRLPCMLFLGVMFNGWLILEVLQGLESGLAYLGWAILLGFFAYGTGLRATIREKYKIGGNMCEDFFAVMLLYPLATVQMEEHVEIARRMPESDSEKGEVSGIKAYPGEGEGEHPEVSMESATSIELRKLMEDNKETVI